jgi:N utilization substance protein B
VDKRSNKNPARLFTVQFIYHLFLKENNDLKLALENQTLVIDDLQLKISDFITTYQEPDNEHPDSEISQEQLGYATKILETFTTNYQDITKALKGSIRTPLDSVTPFDRAALLTGITEINYLETPFEIVTNELVTISKSYGSDTSGRFVNGVLDGIGKNKKS